MRFLTRLKKGLFNDMSQEWQPDGSVIITLVDRKDKTRKVGRIRGLYGPNEEEVDLATGNTIT